MKHRIYTLAGICFAVSLIADQITKQMVINAVGLQSQFITEVTDFFNLVLVWNRGISFGVFSNHPEYMPWILTASALMIMVALLVWLRKVTRWQTALALGLVLGGALGNVIDRIRFGAVVDFLDFHAMGYHWPAFNIADSVIFIGVAILLIETIVEPTKAKGETAT